MESDYFFGRQEIENNDLQAFTDIVRLTETPATSSMNSLSTDCLKLQCILHNRPKLLEAFAEIEFVYEWDLLEPHILTHFSQVLNHPVCVLKLQQMYPSTHNQVLESWDLRRLVSVILDLGCYLNTDDFRRAFKGVLEMSGEHRYSIVNDVLYNVDLCGLDKMKALFDIGYFNDIDRNERPLKGSSFEVLANELSNGFQCSDPDTFSYRADVLKLCLLENPCVERTQKVVHSICMFDIRMLRSTGKQPEQISMLPAFHHHGYDFTRCQILADAEDQTEYARFMRKNTGIRSLKGICRVALRKHFTGRSIQQYVNAVDIPGVIKDYILLKDMIELNI